MPQGAISEILLKDSIASSYFLFAQDAPTIILIFILQQNPYKILLFQGKRLDSRNGRGTKTNNVYLTYTLPLKNGTFLTKISSFQNLKTSIYKVS